MTDVFISYSRKDKAFVQVLNQALTESKYDAWVDWENIPLTADWWEEIKAGIEAADTFIFVISPDSIASQVCGQEIDHAVENNKRLVPIVHRDGFDMSLVRSALGKANWLFFKEDNDFDQAFAALVETLNTDLTHVKAHTRLLVRALEWEKKHRNDDCLLRGSDLADAETWLEGAIAHNHAPPPTEQHKNYIAKSREMDDARQRLAAAGEKAKRLVRVGTGVLAGTVAIATIIGILTVRAFRQLEIAKTATRLEREGNLALQQMDDAPLDSLLMAVRSGKALQDIVRPGQVVTEYPTTTPVIALRTILDNIQEQNKIRAHEGGAVEALSMSPDGSLIATAGWPASVVKIWNLAGELVAELEGHNGFVNRVQFSPDGDVLATGGNDGTVRLWTVDGTLLVEMTDDFERVLDIGFNAEGDRLVTSSQDGMVRIWTIEGDLHHRFSAASIIEEESSGLGIEFRWDEATSSIIVNSVFEESPAQASGVQAGDRITAIDDQPLATEEDKSRLFGEIGKSSTLTIAREGEPDFQRTIQRQTYMMRKPAELFSVMFNADGQQILTGDRAGYIGLWSVSGEKLLDITAYNGEVTQVLFSPDGTQILSIGRGDPGKLWSLDGQLLNEIPLENQLFFKNAAFSPDGQTIATVGEAGITELWNLKGERIMSFKGHNSLLFAVDFSADGYTLATGDLNGVVRLWDLVGHSDIQFQAHGGRIYGAEFSPDGQQIVTVGGSGSADSPKLWANSGELIAEFRQDGVASNAVFSPDGQYVVTTNDDRVARLWSVSGELRAVMDGHRGSVINAAFSPDGKTLATVGADETARLWTLSGENILTFIAAPNARVYSVDFSPDGQSLATSGQDGVPRLWTLEGEPITELVGHEGGVNVIQFSPDGQQLLTAGQDSTVRLWSVDGEQMAELRGHQGEVWVARFSPNGEHILSAGEGGTIRLWTRTGMPIGEFRTGQQLIPSANFSPDGNTLLIGGGDGRIRLLSIEDRSLEELLESGCAWLADYLMHYPTVKDSDRTLCNLP